MSNPSAVNCYDLSGVTLVLRIVDELAKEGYTPYSFLEYYEFMNSPPWSEKRTPEDIKGRLSLLKCLRKNIARDSHLEE